MRVQRKRPTGRAPAMPPDEARARMQEKKLAAARQAEADRLAVAAVLAKHGPQWGETLARLAGLSLERFWEAMRACPWFRLTGPGYALTDDGRAALAATAPAAQAVPRREPDPGLEDMLAAREPPTPVIRVCQVCRLGFTGRTAKVCGDRCWGVLRKDRERERRG